MNRNRFTAALAALAFAAPLLFNPTRALAHCDTMDGPVVKAAQQALVKNDVNLVLHWVQKSDEPEIKNAFAQTLAVRNLGPEAKQLADRYFFETLVRVHRAGEGAPYTGLKPAGTDPDPSIAAADKAIESGDIHPVLESMRHQIVEGIHSRFKEAIAKSRFAPDDIDAGREFVRAYVEFIHYVERVHEALKAPGHAHEHSEHQ